MHTPENLFYSKEHEWVRVEGNKGYIGISDFAQHQLGDIVFVELPELDLEINLGESIGVIESVKAAATLFSPVPGTIIEVNEDLEEAPELLNQDPYHNWIAVLDLSDSSRLEGLMSAEAYNAYCQTLES
ncbi:MAG: glycine cleavage system protein GcvH [Syntrophomonadaceae bacterium]|nr:glycine cleavage system protein GcvH [Syntrophomonadaceae bacterium]